MKYEKPTVTFTEIYFNDSISNLGEWLASGGEVLSESAITTFELTSL